MLFWVFLGTAVASLAGGVVAPRGSHAEYVLYRAAAIAAVAMIVIGMIMDYEQLLGQPL